MPLSRGRKAFHWKVAGRPACLEFQLNNPDRAARNPDYAVSPDGVTCIGCQKCIGMTDQTTAFLRGQSPFDKADGRGLSRRA